ncbi:Putative glycosyl transferase [Nitrosotalea devaniterrae]|uniref:Glycosyl transferase n=1 Tax=Nitrosotalea devaniterrae TaxID=1078905 RepID=A0A128A0N9_9ARCH|nr:Putative glycosyl transferase [Candidatus Nitrosotalea devanaterra]
MKHIDRPSGCFVDRHLTEPNLESVDVIMLSLDAEDFLEKSLYTIYREIPVNRLFVCDGGSKDQTLELLENFPRVEIHARPDLKTAGKALEFLFSLVTTEWFVLVDTDIELFPGWFDEMSKNQHLYDALESSKRLRSFHFYREDKPKLDEHCRSLDLCHLLRKKSIKNFHCDDDYMWRFTDILLRQVIETSGFKYGKIDTTSHIHNETESIRYQSDNTKNYEKIVFDEPQHVIIDIEKFKQWRVKHAKAIAKYLDPEHPIVKADRGNEAVIKILDREWIIENAPKWIKYYTPDDNKDLEVESLVTQIGDEKMKKLVKEIANLKNSNAEYQKTIDAIHNSFTWKTLRKYDKIIDKVLGRKER